jgi:hypothetical protein
MTMGADRKAMAQVLAKMLKDGYVGGRHGPLENILRCFPKHARGEGKKATEELIRVGFVRAKKTQRGIDVAVNPVMGKEITEFVRKYKKF